MINNYNYLVSIIIPVFNSEKYLERCIISVLNQSYKNIQIIIINDGSSDSSIEIIKKYATLDKRIEYIDKINEGISKTRNCGLRIATGDFITFVDSDDYIEDNMIQKLLDIVIEKNVDIAICFDKSWKRLDSTIKVIDATDYRFGQDYSSLVAWGGLYARSVIQNIKFDESIYVSEDILYKAMAIRKAKKVGFIFEPLYNYIVYQDSTCHGKYNKSKLTELFAWEKIVEIFKNTRTENSALIAYNKRCRYVLENYYGDDEFEYEDYKYCIKQYRKSYKYNFKYSNLKDRIVGVIFYFLPKLIILNKKRK